MICCRYFKVSKVEFDVDVWAFKLNFNLDILVFLGDFSQNWVKF
jgi:hypothetical protein